MISTNLIGKWPPMLMPHNHLIHGTLQVVQIIIICIFVSVNAALADYKDKNRHRSPLCSSTSKAQSSASTAQRIVTFPMVTSTISSTLPTPKCHVTTAQTTESSTSASTAPRIVTFPTVTSTTTRRTTATTKCNLIRKTYGKL